MIGNSMDRSSVSLLREDFATRIGVQLKRMQKRRNMTQAGLAKAMGTSQGNIPRLLEGIQPPKLLTLAKAAKALGYSVRITFIEETELNK